MAGKYAIVMTDSGSLPTVNGMVNAVKYYGINALSTGMDMYNKTLIEFCNSRDLEYIELDKMIPRDISAFYDDVHFNENGAKLVADAISVYLKEN